MTESSRREKDLPMAEEFEYVRGIDPNGRSVNVPKSLFGGNLDVASEEVLGGVKASPKSETDTNEVKIDPNTGKLYCPPSEVAMATAEQIGGIVADVKTSEETVEVKIDPNTGKAYVKPSSNLDVATSDKLGGIKASERTEAYTVEVKIDKETGKLYVPEGDGTPPDDEDITTATVEGSKVLQFKNRDTSKGKGYVILRSGKSLTEQLTKENTIYEIRYDFDLEGQNLKVPSGCILLFNGGTLGNGQIEGDKTFIKSYKRRIFKDDITLTGTFSNSELFASYFGVDRGTDVTSQLQAAISNASSSGVKKLVLDNGSYYVSGTITIPPRMDFGGVTNESLSSWKYTGEVPTILQTANAPVFSVADSSTGTRNISIHDIAIRASTDYTGSKNNMHGIYADSTINVTGCTFRNIFLEGLRFGMYFNVVNGGGFTENTFINVGALRNTIGIFIDCSTTSNRAWFNHNYFRLCYLNENTCGAVFVKNIQSIQTILFQSCNFEQNGRGYNTTDYAEYGCFGFRAGSMLYGTVLFDSCYFEGTVPRNADNANDIYSTVNYNKEAHVIFNAGQVEIRNSIIARTRQFVTVGSTGSVFLSKNEYYLTTRINSNFSTCLVRYLGLTGSGKTSSLVIKEPTLGTLDTYIDRPYEFNYTSYSSANTFYQGNLDIEAPLFQKEKTRLGVYEPETTFYINTSNGNNDFNGLSKAHPFLNLSTFRYYGASRYGKIRRYTIILESDLSDVFSNFGSSNPIKDTEILINGNGHTLTINDKAVIHAYNVKIRFVNCNIVVDNQTAYYSTLYVSGKSELIFEDCTITFNTGKSTYFINGGAYGLLNVTFKNTDVTSLGTPSDLYLIRTREDSEVKVYSSGFTKHDGIIMMSETALTESMVSNADTYGGLNRVRMSRREDGAAYIYSDKNGKFHNAGGSLISKVTIL